MANQKPGISPARIIIDGVEWVPASWADELAEMLREKQRTQASHNHQFAEIHDLWGNLPISHASAPYAASAEAFRKHGLIATGHCDVDTISFESQDAAKKAAPFIAKLARKAHGYALTVVRGPLVVCSTPHSQSYKAMGKEVFEQSKRDVLNWGHEILGVTP
jgi:hypothetical protein